MQPKICLNCGSLDYVIESEVYDYVMFQHNGDVVVDDTEYGDVKYVYCYECDEDEYLIDFEMVAEHKEEIAKALLNCNGEERILIFAQLVKDGKIRIRSEKEFNMLIEKLNDMGYGKLALLLKVNANGDG